MLYIIEIGLKEKTVCIAKNAFPWVIHRIQSENLHYFIWELRIELRNWESIFFNPTHDELFIQLRYIPSYSNHQYSFRVSYKSILTVAGILIRSDLKSEQTISTFKTPSFFHSLWVWRCNPSIAGDLNLLSRGASGWDKDPPTPSAGRVKLLPATQGEEGARGR